MATIINAHETASLIAEKNAVLIDTREPEEFRRLRIPGAKLMPLSILSRLTPAEETNRPAIFFCHSGRRTLNHSTELEGRGYKQTYILEGGITAWKASGLPVVEERAPLSLMRQIRIAAGSLVLVFALLSFIYSGFIWGAIFVGAGLVFSGITDFCGIAHILMKMPWNKNL